MKQSPTRSGEHASSHGMAHIWKFIMLFGALMLAFTLQASMGGVRTAQSDDHLDVHLYVPMLRSHFSAPALAITENSTSLGVFDLVWTHPDVASGSFWLLQMSTSADFSSREIYTVFDTNYSIDLNDHSGTRYFRVAGVNNYGISDWSNVVSGVSSQFRVGKNTINADANECTTLSWDYEGIKSIRISFGFGFDREAQTGVGTETICPSVTTTYSAEVTFANDTVSIVEQTVTVTGTSCNRDPYIKKLESDKNPVNVREEFTVSWEVQCASTIFFKRGDDPEVAATGNESRSFAVTKDTTFGLRVKKKVSGTEVFNHFGSITVTVND